MYGKLISLMALLIFCGCVPSVSSEGLQSLIDNANDGDVVQVPVGTYTENIFIDKNLTLQGTDENNTIIDGNKTGSAITIGFYYPVDVTLSKLTIKNGSAHEGGGIYIDKDCNVTAEDCRIKRNMALQSSGGVYVERDSSFKLVGTKIFLNYADFGGGIYTNGVIDLGTGEVYHNFASPHTGGGISSNRHGGLTGCSTRMVYENTPDDNGGPVKWKCCCKGQSETKACSPYVKSCDTTAGERLKDCPTEGHCSCRPNLP